MSQAVRKSSTLKIIPAERVRILDPQGENPGAPADEPEPEPAAPAKSAAACPEPEVILLKDGSRVKTIVIKCACGQVTCLDCEY